MAVLERMRRSSRVSRSGGGGGARRGGRCVATRGRAASGMNSGAVMALRTENAGAQVQQWPTSVLQRQRRRSRAGRSVAPRRGESLVANGLFGLGVPELLVIGGVVAVVFGPQQLPQFGKMLGKTAKGFQEAAGEFKDELKKGMEEEEEETKQEEDAVGGGD